MKKGPLILGAILALAFAAALILYLRWQPGVGPGERAPAASGPRTAPPFTLPDLSGASVSSERFRGKPTVVNFFATWCPPCREEIPGFVEVYERHKGSGFELVGISLDTDTRDRLPVFVRENRIGYRILIGDVETARAYGGVSSIPTTFFIGKDGQIRNVHVGYMDKETFDAEVRKLL